MNTLTFLAPGDPDTRTGGYIYDARIVRGLRALGWTVDRRRLHASFPMPDSVALAHAAQELESIDDHALVLIDGLAFGAMPALARQHRKRLRLLALVHHPLAAETGLSAQQLATLAHSEKCALSCARHVIVTGSRTAATLREHYAVPADKLSVVVPGTDPVTRAARPTRSAVPTAGTSCDKPPPVRLLCVATVTPRKGHESLIKALAQLASRRWQLRCAGSLEHSPETVQRVRAAVHKAHLHEQVTLLGELDDEHLRDCYAWADVFVLATYLEGYGMALAEAIAHGLPIVTTAGGAAADTVGTQAALLVPADDPEALSQALQRVMYEPQLRSKLGAAAHQRAQQLPAWQDASTSMHDILTRLQMA